MNKMESIRKRNETELQNGTAGTTASWHEDYITNEYIFIGSLPIDATEGDLLTIFEQFGTILLINLVRDKVTGQSKRFAFLKYEDARSCVLAVDNFNGIQLGDSTITVDHATLRSDYDYNQGIDTTPVKQVTSTIQGTDSNQITDAGQEENVDADLHREKLVKKRMKELSKKRKLEEAETKDEEKKKRKLERAKKREEREKRRSQRQAVQNKQSSD